MLLVRSLLLSLFVFCSALVSDGVLPSHAQEMSQATEEKIESADPFAVPDDLTPDELLQFIQQFFAKRPLHHGPTQDDDKVADLMATVADRIMAASPTEEMEREARSLKIRALMAKVSHSQNDWRDDRNTRQLKLEAALAELKAYVAELEKNEAFVDLAANGRYVITQRQFLDFFGKLKMKAHESDAFKEDIGVKLSGIPVNRKVELAVLLAPISDNIDPPPAIVDEFNTFKKDLIAKLKDGPLDSEKMNMMLMFVNMSDSIGPGPKLTAETYRDFVEIIADSKEEKFARMRTYFEGHARCLELIGNEIGIEGTTLDGKEFDWKSYRGKIVLVDFGLTTKPTYMYEIPNLKKQYEKYKDQGLEIVIISRDDNIEELKKFAETEEIPWVILPNARDSKQNNRSMAEYYDIYEMPRIILVSRDGKVLSIDVRKWRGLDSLMETMFSNP